MSCCEPIKAHLQDKYLIPAMYNKTYSNAAGCSFTLKLTIYKI